MHFTKEVTENRSVLKFLTDFKWNGTCSVILKDHSSNDFISLKQDSRMKVKSTYTRHRYIFGFLLFIILLPVSTMSVPIRGERSSDKSNNAEKPKWVNPCPGVPTGSAEKRSTEDESTSSDTDYINSILLTAKQAVYQAQTFKEAYVLNTFKVQLKMHHSTWRDVGFDWLRKGVVIPKDLGQPAKKSDMEATVMINEIVNIYGFLQRLAVAFEQIIDDHRDMNSEFKDEFKLADENLKNILCELREIIPESKLALFDNTSRDVMIPEYRHMENLTHRHVRDWLIFRDYLNLIEYLVQLMEHFKQKTV